MLTQLFIFYQESLTSRSAELLLTHIEQPHRRTETVLIAPELVVRGSTAAPVG